MKRKLTLVAAGWAAVLFLAISSYILRAEEFVPTIVYSTTNHVHPGQKIFVRLNALNGSDNEFTWVAPESIDGELRERQRTWQIILEATGTKDSRRLLLKPRSFATIDYMMVVPSAVSKQAVLKLQTEPVTHFVMNVSASKKTVTDIRAEGKSRVVNWLRDVAPEGSPRSYDPARFFKQHISGYEPLYFIAGTESPNAKFQISFKYQLFNEHGYLGSRYEALDGIHIAYTQTSLWDWNAPSAPFFDSSYKPEFLYAWEEIVGGEADDKFQIDLQLGLQHESNGKEGMDSRSLNIAYVRPTFVFGGDRDLQLTLQPRAWLYVGDIEDNRNIAEYRGYADLRMIVGWKRGLQISATGRIGNSFENEALQLDLTYPLMRFFYSNFSIYLHAQYFTGYGESLLRYDEKSSVFRAGISLYR